MTILTVRHVTTYTLSEAVAFGEHRMMFRPRDSYDQRLIDSRLVITPEPASLRSIHDPFGNCVALAQFAMRAPSARTQGPVVTLRIGRGRASAAVSCVPAPNLSGRSRGRR